MNKTTRNIVFGIAATGFGFILLGVLNDIFFDSRSSSSGASATSQPAPVVPQPPAPPQKPMTPAERRKADADAKNAAAADAAQKELDRVLYAKSYENSLLDQDMNVDVRAYGLKHRYLEVKYALASKVLAHQIEENPELLRTFQEKGFTKFVLTDGYENNWTWDLAK